ncbi:hypothetical protein PGT21_021283 [Puccinia graminis f. sp. tritici]|uniref:Uncharacterized protein n=2 Tax=Puccinia graminis f. sp. tritici TaxID=56615 RepID=E3KC61_PUCGT|nr:uncharacterized protein PGTG_08253 [Puccinia graminis f. sp. tritici CRL 75-36-700-3]KAA1095349.1 hypothetical protein PGTUg99_024567 [Puccinia graminis f. sp. tritici]EFP82004.1 hypothetical protein PGTG_08253 [Puccinia graminis f. sp. tritici CRL 75-36-700-3]KAA1099688.1 hypothetical protein PGT21_017175 [Puccinia graminis f. sp. tritici]KAA1117725.1 hypothetical protein PGT21_021283 [Puccinia graminis f. sp. tritici]KAA1138051.1 hypothetical protein PGTUg99_026540 [Puccinia graminis f. s
MVAYYNHFVLSALIAFLAGESLAIECDSRLIPHRPVRKAECMRAISQIVYNSDNTLDTTSKRVDYTFGECNVSIYNDLGIEITKAQVEHRFNKILDKCRYDAGGNDFHDNDPVFFYIGNRAIGRFQSWDSDFPTRLPTCAVEDNAPALYQDDCIKAFSDIATDTTGRILTDDYKQTDQVEKTYKSCTINVYTYDFSKLDVTKPELEDDFVKTLQYCSNKCGVIRIVGGTHGPNGRVYLSFKHAQSQDSCSIYRSPLRTQ